MTLDLTVKEVFLYLKNKVFTGQSVALEAYSADVANRSILSMQDVKTIYRNMIAMKKYVNKPTLAMSRKVIWDSSEDIMMLHYFQLSSREAINVKGVVKNKTRILILTEMADILVHRTESSIAFRYQQLKKDKNKPKTKGLSVVENTIAQNSENSAQNSTQKDDLLDIVVDTIDNLDTAGVDITDLFKGILKLSKCAVENSNVDMINGLEEKVNALKGRNNFLENELIKERDNSQKAQDELARLVSEFESLCKEIDNFERLNGKQKLKQLGNYSSRMKYLVGQYGNVDVVAN